MCSLKFPQQYKSFIRLDVINVCITKHPYYALQAVLIILRSCVRRGMHWSGLFCYTCHRRDKPALSNAHPADRSYRSPHTVKKKIIKKLIPLTDFRQKSSELPKLSVSPAGHKLPSQPGLMAAQHPQLSAPQPRRGEHPAGEGSQRGSAEIASQRGVAPTVPALPKEHTA